MDAATKAAGLSERSLRRRCQAELGIGWDEYRRRVRLLAAFEPLADPSHQHAFTSDELRQLGRDAGLSDCVITVQAQRRSDLESLRDWLSSNWPMLEAQYVGSCARYITVLRLRDLLAKAALPTAVAPQTAIGPGETTFLNRNRAAL